MTNTALFEPRWASAPGETILEALRERGKSVEDLADSLRCSDAEARQLVRGDTAITEETAEGLAAIVGGTTTFWLSREAQYRDNLGWVSADQLVANLPFDQMVEFGWVRHESKWRDRASACLEFFQVDDAEQWNTRYGRVLEEAHFRASVSFQSSDASVAAWLRQAEIEAAELSVATWSPELFRRVVAEVRRLTKLGDPATFLPKLQSLCAQAGVAVVVVRAPNDCPINGAALTTGSGVPLIVLSARFLADDQLWFTFFHEAGHVLLHDLAATYLDEFDDDSGDNALESEANDFARACLVGPGFEELGSGRANGPTMREVVAYSYSAGIAPGIVVGQLQHDGRLRFNQLNRLKRRYSWDGSTLKI